MMRSRLRRLSAVQKQVVLETLRNDTTLAGDEIMKFERLIKGRGL
jgi:hypothetical protein